MRDANHLTAAQVLFIHEALINATGGAHGVRDVDALEAAVGRPRAGLEDRELYPTSFTKAAALFQSLIVNHPFIDGNKRTGVTAAGLFLELNGWHLIAPPDELEDYAVQIATDAPTVAGIAAWLERYSRRSEE